MEYKTTKQECEGTISHNGYVCSQCGSNLSAIETVDNSGAPTFWPGCEKCSRFDYGVSPIIFQVAKEMVTEQYYVHYSHLGSNYNLEGEKLKYWTDTQIGGTSSLVAQIVSVYKKAVNAAELKTVTE